MGFLARTTLDMLSQTRRFLGPLWPPGAPGLGSRHPCVSAPRSLIGGVGKSLFLILHDMCLLFGVEITAFLEPRFPRRGEPGSTPSLSGRPEPAAGSAGCGAPALSVCPLTARGGEGFPWGLW